MAATGSAKNVMSLIARNRRDGGFDRWSDCSFEAGLWRCLLVWRWGGSPKTPAPPIAILRGTSQTQGAKLMTIAMDHASPLDRKLQRRLLRAMQAAADRGQPEIRF